MCGTAESGVRVMRRQEDGWRPGHLVGSPTRRKLVLSAGMVLAAAILSVGCAGGTTAPAEPNSAPVAAFVYNPLSPIVAGRTTVTFDASASQDLDGRIASYSWAFGDGTAEQVSTVPIVTHVFRDTPVYCDQVVYAVQLTVRDDQGEPASGVEPVDVIELPDPRVVECQPGTTE